MNAAQIKSELRRLGLRAEVRKDRGGGHCYELRTLRGDSVASGWDNGNKTDALRSAYEAALSRAKVAV